MEFIITDPDILLHAPAETRILDLQASPCSVGKRMRVTLELSPFQQRPEIELNLTDSAGKQVASVSIIEPVSWKLDLTLHIRYAPIPDEKFTLTAMLFYADLGEVDKRNIIIEFPAPAS